MVKEQWKDIPGFEGHYQASTLGNIRSIKKEPIILKGDYQKNGYRRVYLWVGGEKKNCLVHRLVAETFIENPNRYSDINHKDENNTNNALLRCMEQKSGSTRISCRRQRRPAGRSR